MKKEKRWTKPELLVLMRNRPEEAVLFGCKGAVNKGPDYSDAKCTISSGTAPGCERADKS